MRSTSSVLAFLFILAIHGSADAQQTKVIRASRLFDGARVLADVLVVIEGDRIARIGNTSESVPLDGRGRRPA